jgi:hypothetical protein
MLQQSAVSSRGESSARRGRAERVILRAVEEDLTGGVAAPGVVERQERQEEEEFAPQVLFLNPKP